ncbi:MAG: hypothetical protein R6X20_04840 [Phycisphaerae bacterium]
MPTIEIRDCGECLWCLRLHRTGTALAGPDAWVCTHPAVDSLPGGPHRLRRLPDGLEPPPWCPLAAGARRGAQAAEA